MKFKVEYYVPQFYCFFPQKTAETKIIIAPCRSRELLRLEVIVREVIHCLPKDVLVGSFEIFRPGGEYIII